MLCEHANENPLCCTCPRSCPCRDSMCKGRPRQVSTDDLAKRRSSLVVRASFKRREEALKDQVRSLPPREQLRLAADFAEAGLVDWAINIAGLAIKRLTRGDKP